MNSCAPFVRKTYDLVSDKNTSSVVSWSENGTTFTIWDSETFQRDILPRYFKHNNLCSFIRQLNTYGFHKVNAPESVGGLEFSHPSFKQGSKKLLSQVRRRNSKTKKVEKIAKNQPIADQRVAEALFSWLKDKKNLTSYLLLCARNLMKPNQ